jgi:hypothetical protein
LEKIFVLMGNWWIFAWATSGRSKESRTGPRKAGKAFISGIDRGLWSVSSSSFVPILEIASPKSSDRAFTPLAKSSDTPPRYPNPKNDDGLATGQTPPYGRRPEKFVGV